MVVGEDGPKRMLRGSRLQSVTLSELTTVRELRHWPRGGHTCRDRSLSAAVCGWGGHLGHGLLQRRQWVKLGQCGGDCVGGCDASR